MKKYSQDVMKALRKSLGAENEKDTSLDKEIMSMDKEEAFERYCKYKGLLGCWYKYLMDAIESIYGVKLSQ